VTSLGIGHGWSRAPAVLDPPPTPEEIAWWKATHASTQRKRVLGAAILVQFPLIVGAAYVKGWPFVLSWAGADLLIKWAFIGGLSGFAQWALVRNARFRHEILSRRLRDAILEPDR
jgi:hypothetical protein